MAEGGDDRSLCRLHWHDARTFFPRACTLHAPLPLCFVRQPCSQELSGGVPNGMFSIVFGPYVCVWVTAYICMNEKE